MKMPPSLGPARLLEAVTALAPALLEQRVAGLLLREARGFQAAANCALPGSGVLPDALSMRNTAEAFFRARGLPPRFLLSDAPAHAQLDAHLAAAGYERGERRQIYWTSGTARDRDQTRRFVSLNPASFAEFYGRLSARSAEAIKLQSLRLHALAQGNTLGLFADQHRRSCLLALAPRSTEPSCRLGLLGDLYVEPTARGQGLGRHLLHHGVAWLREQGCTTVLLEVAANNKPARNLYEASEFSLACASWYRVAR